MSTITYRCVSSCLTPSHARLTHPQWVVDSLLRKTLLPVANYRLEGDVDRTATSYQSFFQSSVSNDNAYGGEMSEEGPISSQPTNQEQKSAIPNSAVNEKISLPIALPPPLAAPPGHMKTSAENPNFVRDYFKHSRLHHLSSWSAITSLCVN